MKTERKRSRRVRGTRVTSLIEFRAKRELAAGNSLEVVRRGLGNDGRPLGNRGATDIQSTSNVHRLFEVRDDVSLEHAGMLTIVSTCMQPCSTQQPVTLVNMNWENCSDFAARLAWAMERAGVTVVQLANACEISRTAAGKWLNGTTKDMKMAHLFAAAELCLVNAKWLGTGEGSPHAGVPSLYKDISGPDLQIAKQLTALDNKRLRETIRHLIESSADKKIANAKKVKKEAG